MSLRGLAPRFSCFDVAKTDGCEVACGDVAGRLFVFIPTHVALIG